MSQTIKGLTLAGQAMKARLEAYGIPFRITRIMSGSEASDNPLSLTQLPSPRQEFSIISREQQDASAILRASLSNEALEEGYSLWTIGIYAESDDTPETLYRIIQFDSPRPVPPYKEAGFHYRPVFYLTSANSEQITVAINPDWTDEAAAEAKKRADDAYVLAQEALEKAGTIDESILNDIRDEIDELKNFIGIIPIDGGTFFEEYDPFAADGGTF